MTVCLFTSVDVVVVVGNVAPDVVVVVTASDVGSSSDGVIVVVVVITVFAVGSSSDNVIVVVVVAANVVNVAVAVIVSDVGSSWMYSSTSITERSVIEMGNCQFR